MTIVAERTSYLIGQIAQALADASGPRRIASHNFASIFDVDADTRSKHLQLLAAHLMRITNNALTVLEADRGLFAHPANDSTWHLAVRPAPGSVSWSPGTQLAQLNSSLWVDLPHRS